MWRPAASSLADKRIRTFAVRKLSQPASCKGCLSLYLG